jgi:hypothetical protein
MAGLKRWVKIEIASLPRVARNDSTPMVVAKSVLQLQAKYN